MGQCCWRERKGMSVDTAAILIYFNTEMSFSIPSVLCCDLLFCPESAQVFSPCQVFPCASFCSPLAYRSCHLLSSGSFFISLEFGGCVDFSSFRDSCAWPCAWACPVEVEYLIIRAAKSHWVNMGVSYS